MEFEINEEQHIAAERYLREISNYETQELNFVLPYGMSKKFRSLMLMEVDVKFAKETSQRLIDMSRGDSDKIALRCFWQAIVTTYGKICTKSESGFSSISESWFENETTLLNAHHSLMEWRHKFVAHREESEHEKSKAFFVIIKTWNQPEIRRYHIRSLARVMPTPNEMNDYLAVFDYLLLQIASKIETEATRLLVKFYAMGREKVMQFLIDEHLNPLTKTEDHKLT